MTVAQQPDQQPVKHVALTYDHVAYLLSQPVYKLPRMRNAFIQLSNVFGGFQHN
jgi:hypothetical protein